MLVIYSRKLLEYIYFFFQGSSKGLNKTEKYILILDFLLENVLDFETVNTYSSVKLFEEFLAGTPLPSAEELRTSVLAYKSEQLFILNKSYQFINLIIIYTKLINDTIIAISFAVTTANQKIFLLLSEFHINDYFDKMTVLCRQSIINMFNLYEKIVNFIVYQSQDGLFIEFNAQVSRTVHGTSFDSMYYCVPCNSQVVSYLKSKTFLIEDYDEKTTYLNSVNEFEKNLPSLNAHDALEKIFKLMNDVTPIEDLESTDEIFSYCNPLALAANFLNPLSRGKCFLSNVPIYQNMLEFITNHLDHNIFDYFAKYVSKREEFRMPYETTIDRDVIKYWKKVKVSANATESLQTFCDFACDLLNVPCVVKTDLDFERILHYKRDALGKDYMHIFMIYIMQNAVFS